MPCSRHLKGLRGFALALVLPGAVSVVIFQILLPKSPCCLEKQLFSKIIQMQQALKMNG
jgi:hypothetical protein